jgi:hypothetical protein
LAFACLLGGGGRLWRQVVGPTDSPVPTSVSPPRSNCAALAFSVFVALLTLRIASKSSLSQTASVGGFNPAAPAPAQAAVAHVAVIVRDLVRFASLASCVRV